MGFTAKIYCSSKTGSSGVYTKKFFDTANITGKSVANCASAALNAVYAYAGEFRGYDAWTCDGDASKPSLVSLKPAANGV